MKKKRGKGERKLTKKESGEEGKKRKEKKHRLKIDFSSATWHNLLSSCIKHKNRIFKRCVRAEALVHAFTQGTEKKKNSNINTAKNKNKRKKNFVL